VTGRECPGRACSTDRATTDEIGVDRSDRTTTNHLAYSFLRHSGLSLWGAVITSLEGAKLVRPAVRCAQWCIDRVLTTRSNDSSDSSGEDQRGHVADEERRPALIAVARTGPVASSEVSL
jgi:hypothetical protein